MFFNRDRTELAIEETLGKTVAGAYRQAKANDPLLEHALIAAFRMANLFPEGAQVLKPLLREELEYLINLSTSNTTGSSAAVVLIGAAASAYGRWSLIPVPASVPIRLRRLNLIPAGWRFDALSGLRYWSPSLFGQVPPLKAWMTDLYTISAALSWDAAVKIETWIEFDIPGLTYALQAIALDSIVKTLVNSEQILPAALTMALPLVLNGYADGLAKNIWVNILNDVSSSISPTSTYNALALRATAHGIKNIEPFETDSEKAPEFHADLEDFLSELVEEAIEFGKKYSQLINRNSEDRLLQSEFFIFSAIF